MIQAGQRPGFAGETFGKRRVLSGFRWNDLQSHDTVKIFLAGFIDAAHAAAAEEFKDFKLRKVLGERCHIFWCRWMRAK